MAAPRVSSTWPRTRKEAAVARVSAGSLVLAVAIPFLFLHVHYQPDLGFRAGGTQVDVSLSDLAVVAVAIAALAAGLTAGFAPLRRGVPVWIAAAVFLAVALVSLSYPVLRDEPYDWHARLVSALKLCEYAALALAVPLIVRSRDDARLPLRALVGWSAVATVVGLLQYLGVVHQFLGRRPAEREPSLLGYHDFAALSGGALALAVVVLVLADEELLGRAWVWLAVAAGGVGLVLSGALTGVIGIWLAIGALAFVAWRRGVLEPRATALVAVVAVVVTLGTAGIRSAALRDFAGFLGLHRNETPGAVESYAQRTVLAYIGLRIFTAHPLTGVGFQGSGDEWAYRPVLGAAHRRFPGQPAEAFPSPEHPWGVQNLYVQTLADLGVIGAAALAALFGSAAAVGLRGGARATLPLVGLAWLLVAVGIWIGIGIVPGIPLAALTWLGLGLVTVRA